YRRFFTINGLVCVNIQDPAVFDFHHRKILELAREGVFNGLRIDHIDGLYDPTAYLNTLRREAGNDKYMVVEKILQFREGLPGKWPVQGNTGYDFLAMVNNVFTNRDAEPQFTQFYQELISDDSTIQKHLRDKKALILYRHMGGDLNNLYGLLTESGLVGESEL